MLTLLAKLLRILGRAPRLVLALTPRVGALGVYNFTRLPIDAVPDITNVQVQINTPVEALSPVEVERQITFPIEAAMGGIPQGRAGALLSRYGLSQVTVVFEDGTDIYWARQLVAERLAAAKESLPPGLAEPQMGPIATGLGEIYMWTLEAEPGAQSPTAALRAHRSARAPGLGGTAPAAQRPRRDRGQLHRRLRAPLSGGPGSRRSSSATASRSATCSRRWRRNNGPTRAAGYIEHRGEQYLVRATGLVKDEADIRNPS
jgi:cobalt-zinc-cadmium resistance protein CzcA